MAAFGVGTLAVAGLATFFIADSIAQRAESDRLSAWILYLIPLISATVVAGIFAARAKSEGAPRASVSGLTVALLGPSLVVGFFVRRAPENFQYVILGLCLGLFLGLTLIAIPVRRLRAARSSDGEPQLSDSKRRS